MTAPVVAVTMAAVRSDAMYGCRPMQYISTCETWQCVAMLHVVSGPTTTTTTTTAAAAAAVNVVVVVVVVV